MSDYLLATGWLTPAERNTLHDLARDTEGTIVNIGIEYGASLHCLRAGNPVARIVGIDTIGDDKLEGNPMAEIIRGDSGKVAEKWTEPIELLFVDGDHSYTGVMRDWMWTEYIVPGGVVAWHDCYEWPPADPKSQHPAFPSVNAAVFDWFALNHHKWNELETVDSMRIFQRLKNG